MRRDNIAPGEHYHVFNRGVNKQVIFHDSGDYYRFLFLVLYFQSDKTFSNIGRSIEDFVQHRVLNNEAQEVIQERNIEILNFCIMPNHFHLMLKETNEGGISRYIQRILNAYSKYYNTKYEKSGHVFQGPYRAVHIEDNDQLLYLSAYIHRNPRELPQWKNKEDQYKWSSYMDLIGMSRWGGLLKSEIIVEQFKDKDHYHTFVKSSTAKLLEEELSYLEYLDK